MWMTFEQMSLVLRLYGLWFHLFCVFFFSLVFTLVGWSGGSSSLLVTSPLVCEGSQTPALVISPLVCGGSLSAGVPWLVTPLCGMGNPAFGVLTGDSSLGLQGELASASAVGDSTSWSLGSESDGDSSSLLRGMDALLSVFTWGLPWRQLKAVSL